MKRIDELAALKRNGEDATADEMVRNTVYEMFAEGSKRTGGVGPKAGEIVLTRLIDNHLAEFDGLIIPQGLARVMTGCSEVRDYDFVAVAGDLADELSGETAVVMRLTLPEDRTCNVCFYIEPAMLDLESDVFDQGLAEFIETEGFEYQFLSRITKK